MRKADVLALCESVCPAYGIDPVFLLALCEQESGYDETEVRLENGFYRRYSRPMQLPASTEVLFSASYGLTQIMGEVLDELGYFEGSEGIAAGIDAFMMVPRLHIEYACRQIARLRKSTGSVRRILLRYNGGVHYPQEVWSRYERLCKEFDRSPDESPV